MAALVIPHLGDPDGISIGRVLRNHIAQAARHTADAFQQDGDQHIALPWHNFHLADQAVHACCSSQRNATENRRSVGICSSPT
jgi:hypothetical protein